MGPVMVGRIGGEVITKGGAGIQLVCELPDSANLFSTIGKLFH